MVADQLVSVQDDLEGEKDSPIRHEYVDGHIYAMGAASDRRITINLASRLNQPLVRGSTASTY